MRGLVLSLPKHNKSDSRERTVSNEAYGVLDESNLSYHDSLAGLHRGSSGWLW
jgi:hypothetical protein